MMSLASLNVEWLPNVAGSLGIAGLLSIAELQRIAGLLRVASLLSIAELQRIAWLLRLAGLASSWLLAIFQLLMISLSLADSEGVALIGLGGVNLDRLKAFSKFNPNFLVLPDPNSYSLSELLLSLRRFLDLWEAFLRVFSNLSDFLLNWANDCFAGLGVLPAFLAARKSTFTILSFLYLQQSLVACVVCPPLCFLHSLQDLSKWTLLWACFVAPVLGRLAPALFL